MAEPPSLFRGRGKHPLTGKLKQRIFPEQVTINVGKESKVPICPQPGHAWGRVQHDDTVTWLSSWHENVLGSNKYCVYCFMHTYIFSMGVQIFACLYRCLVVSYTHSLLRPLK
jgi:DNA topoisomerase IB